jgi:hypothetical protein
LVYSLGYFPKEPKGALWEAVVALNTYLHCSFPEKNLKGDALRGLRYTISSDFTVPSKKEPKGTVLRVPNIFTLFFSRKEPKGIALRALIYPRGPCEALIYSVCSFPEKNQKGDALRGFNILTDRLARLEYIHFVLFPKRTKRETLCEASIYSWTILQGPNILTSFVLFGSLCEAVVARSNHLLALFFSQKGDTFHGLNIIFVNSDLILFLSRKEPKGLSCGPNILTRFVLFPKRTKRGRSARLLSL